MGIRSGALLASFLLVTACGADPDSESGEEPTASESPGATASTPIERTEDPTGRTSATTPPPKADGTTIVVGDSEFGDMLFDDTGQAIYLFDVETTAEPRCYDDCAVAWPPVLTDGEPVAGDGADADLLGTTERADGQLQVTYDDHPLYFYAHEGKHEVLCHDVFLNGGNWYVVQPGGDPAPPG